MRVPEAAAPKHAADPKTPAPARAGASGAWASRWRIEPDDLVDGAAVLVLGALALLGFHSVFDGVGAMVVGTWATLLGIGVALVVALRRLKPLAALGLALVVFLLGAGAAVPASTLAGFIPGPSTPSAFVHGLVHGWADLLTTAPPVGLDTGMGVVPYLVAFVAAIAAMVLARRTELSLVPVLPLLGALVAGLVLGTIEPVSVLLQGSGFALVALAWGSVRANRDRRSIHGEIYWPRIVSGLAMLALIAVVGLVFGPSLPLAHGEPRYVLRDQTVPPFNPETYPSPLAGYRNYTNKKAESQVLFTVDGLPKGARVRLATMDTFDGVVWIVSGQQHAGSGRFERVGSRILPVPPGRSASIDVRVKGYEGVWVPTVAATRSIAFDGTDARSLGEDFRYNRTTGTGAAPATITKGDRFTLDARFPDADDRRTLQNAGVDRSQDLPPLPSDPASQKALAEIQKKAFDFAPKKGSPYAQAEQLAKRLHTIGGYTDGGDGSAGSELVPAGHSIVRIVNFLKRPNGNAEQYASAMALMARQLGLPARVVLGFRPTGSGHVSVTGKDADAWVEIAFQGQGWVAFDPTPDKDQKLKDKQEEQFIEEKLEQQATPPPDYVKPPDELGEVAGRKNRKRKVEQEKKLDPDAGLPRALVLGLTFGGPPVVILLVLAGAVVALKLWRRKRRRSKGSVVQRANGAWLEVMDSLRDLGHRPAGGATRSELATAASQDQWPSGPLFAARLDEVMFGPAEPDDQTVSAVWADLDEQVRAIRGPLTRRQRLRAALSTKSLRRPERRR